MNNTIYKVVGVDYLERVHTLDNDVFDSEKYSLDLLKKSFDNESEVVIVAEDNNKLIGYILFSFVLDEAELLKIGVLESHQRCGVGKNLHAKMEDYLREQNVKNIFLEVRIDNKKAINFYEKNGYEKVTIRENYYNGVHAIVYRKGI